MLLIYLEYLGQIEQSRQPSIAKFEQEHVNIYFHCVRLEKLLFRTVYIIAIFML